MTHETPPAALAIMRRQWLRHLDLAGADKNRAIACFEELVTCYREPHRHYHNLLHIQEMLELAHTVQPQLKQPEAVFYATWYHDAVYSVPSKKNESKSAQMAAARMASMGLERPLIQTVTIMIEATQAHQWPDPEADTAWLLDIDMSILGAQQNRYLAYVQGVEAEHRAIPKFLFNRGRLQFLKTTLARPRIFLTSVFRERFEIAARRNMRDEMQRRGG